MLQLLDTSLPDLIAFRITAQVDANDYAILKPAFEARVRKFDKIRVYAEMYDLEAVTPKAIWEDLKMDIKYVSHVSRVALVGDSKWEELMVKAAVPFVSGDMKYFDFGQRDAAWAWVQDNF